MPESIKAVECSEHTLPVSLSGIYPPCPVTTLAYQTLASAHSLTHMLRRLRISMANCFACHSKADCPILTDFNAQLSVALQEVADEWALA